MNISPEKKRTRNEECYLKSITDSEDQMSKTSPKMKSSINFRFQGNSEYSKLSDEYNISGLSGVEARPYGKSLGQMRIQQQPSYESPSKQFFDTKSYDVIPQECEPLQGKSYSLSKHNTKSQTPEINFYHQNIPNESLRKKTLGKKKDFLKEENSNKSANDLRIYSPKLQDGETTLVSDNKNTSTYHRKFSSNNFRNQEKRSKSPTIYPTPKVPGIITSSPHNSRLESSESESNSYSDSDTSSFSFSPDSLKNCSNNSSSINILQLHLSSTKDLTLLDRIDDLKSQVSASSMSVEVSSAEDGLRTQILEFEKSLLELRNLHTQCTRMLNSFISESERSGVDVNKQLSSLREQMTGFTILDSLEDRIEKVQATIESRTKKLEKINEWVAKEEDILVIKRKRLQRIWKILLIGSTSSLIAIVIIYFWQTNRF